MSLVPPKSARPPREAHRIDEASLARWLAANVDGCRGGGAVTALQFQDMASQLINHTHKRLRSCVDRLAREAFAEEEDGEVEMEEVPLRPNPVTQAEMDVGSIELF